MLPKICDDAENVLKMQHMKKDGFIQTSLMLAFVNIKGPVHMFEGGHH